MFKYVWGSVFSLFSIQSLRGAQFKHACVVLWIKNLAALSNNFLAQRKENLVWYMNTSIAFQNVHRIGFEVGVGVRLCAEAETDGLRDGGKSEKVRRHAEELFISFSMIYWRRVDIEIYVFNITLLFWRCDEILALRTQFFLGNRHYQL